MVDFSFVYDELKDKYSSTIGRKAEEVNLIDPSLLTVFRRERLSNKDNEEETSTNLMDKLIAKTVEIYPELLKYKLLAKF